MGIALILNEQQTLRCIIEQPDLLMKFDKNYFISNIARSIFKAIKNLQDRTPPLPLIPIHITSEGNKLNSNITEELINQLFEVEFDINNFDYYFKRLKEDYAKHYIESIILKDILTTVSSRDELNIEKLEGLVDSLEEQLNLLRGDKKLLYSLSDMFVDYKSVIIRRQQGDWFYGTGDSYLDSALLVGFAPGLITTLFASTGIGKSIYALNLVSKQINKKIPSVYISLEMDLVSTMDRLIALRNRVPIEIFFPNSLQETPDYALKILEKEKEKFKQIKRFYFVEEPSLSLNDIEYIIKEAKKRMHTNYLVVTIDLLTMVKDFNKGGDKQSTVYENAMNKLHEIAKANNVHILGVVQANRQADSYNVKSIKDLNRLKPSINTIKNSNAIAERSRVVLSAFRAKYYAERLFPDDPELEMMEDILEIDILKQNMGKLSHLKYLYVGETANIYKYETPKKEKN